MQVELIRLDITWSLKELDLITVRGVETLRRFEGRVRRQNRAPAANAGDVDWGLALGPRRAKRRPRASHEGVAGDGGIEVIALADVEQDDVAGDASGDESVPIPAEEACATIRRMSIL